MIRIVHEFECEVEGVIDDVRGLRMVLPQAELYRSLAADEERYAIALLAETEAQYGEVLAALDKYPAYKCILNDCRTEIHEQSKYEVVDGVWQPLQRVESPIMWPSFGAVSIVIQGAYEPNESMRALTAEEIADTRREPGCELYAWYENVELENHLMLLEVWTDQRIYDTHWFGRMRSVEWRGNSGRVPAPMERGEAVREFYQEQCFEFHYGHMYPVFSDSYSESVVWSAR